MESKLAKNIRKKLSPETITYLKDLSKDLEKRANYIFKLEGHRRLNLLETEEVEKKKVNMSSSEDESDNDNESEEEESDNESEEIDITNIENIKSLPIKKQKPLLKKLVQQYNEKIKLETEKKYNMYGGIPFLYHYFDVLKKKYGMKKSMKIEDSRIILKKLELSKKISDGGFKIIPIIKIHNEELKNMMEKYENPVPTTILKVMFTLFTGNKYQTSSETARLVNGYQLFHQEGSQKKLNDWVPDMLRKKRKSSLIQEEKSIKKVKYSKNKNQKIKNKEIVYENESEQYSEVEDFE